MARRKELRGIVNALISSFNSRNNDINGYWAIGKLKGLSLKTYSDPIKLNLLSNPPLCQHELCKQIRDQQTCKLMYLLDAQKIPREWVCHARISIHFCSVKSTSTETFRSSLGEFYRCMCEIIDDKGKLFIANSYGYCLPHSTEREFQRITK